MINWSCNKWITDSVISFPCRYKAMTDSSDQPLCYFHSKYGCKPSAGRLQNTSRISKIIECSKIYGDTFHETLEELYINDPNITLQCHKNCISRYVSPSNTRPYLGKSKCSPSEPSVVEPKRLRSDKLFDFKKHCLFCPDVTECMLSNEYPRKVNVTRRKAACMLRSDKRCDGSNYKQQLVLVCDERGDHLGKVVKDRILGAVSDLHAADARYHVDCHIIFFRLPYKCKKSDESDKAFLTVCSIMRDNKEKMWSSIDVHGVYIEEGGFELTRPRIIEKIKDYFGDEIVVLSSPGLAHLLMFQCEAAKTLNLISCDDDDLDNAIHKVGKQITKMCISMKRRRTEYCMHIDKAMAQDCVSSTLLKVLNSISEQFDISLPGIMVGNIVTSVVTKNPTALQIALGVLFGDHKTLLSELYKYGVVCSYYEVLRYKRSAAVAAAASEVSAGMLDAEHGIVQVVVDNFDAVIHSQNCKMMCHSLAMVMTQSSSSEQNDNKSVDNDVFPRISKTEMSQPIQYEVEVQAYQGPKKPPMPMQAATQLVPTLAVLAKSVLSQKRSSENDFGFLQDVVTSPDCPEFNGYNTRLCREAGMLPRPCTRITYLPLIDMTPSDPSTMLTAIYQGGKLTSDTGQNVLIITCDQHLYKVVVDILFDRPMLLPDVIPILGGMHLLMSFIGSIGVLMEGTGLQDLLIPSFGSVDKMLSGKKFPQNMRALRLLMEEILGPVFERGVLTRMVELHEALQEVSNRSRTAKVWVDLFIMPVLIMMQYCRAAHEGDWLLHLHSVRQILPYMFAAGHQNYARYGVYYLRSMNHLPSDVQQRFINGEQTMRHNQGIWNGVWSDMFIETTYMRYGHGPSGIIGTTTKPETLKTWALSMHACTTLITDLLDMDGSRSDAVKFTHKEETSARIRADASDRASLRRTLTSCIDPLNPDAHPPGSIINIATGKIASAEVNVDEALQTGKDQMTTFQTGWPETFYNKISREVKTCASRKKKLLIGDTPVIDQEAIYARVIGLLISNRSLDFNVILASELSAYPPSMFDPTGNMRLAKSKSTLKKSLQVEIPTRAIESNVTVIDGSAVLWTIDWPANGTVQSFIDRVKCYVAAKLKDHDVHLIFDRYYDYSTKSAARKDRSTCSRVHQLNRDFPLPPRDVVLSVTKNKMQLNKLIFEDILEDRSFLAHATQHHQLILTGQDPIPTMITEGQIYPRLDLASSHEEADIVITQQAVMAAQKGSHVTVVADDVDVFVLLVYYYHTYELASPMYMVSPVRERASTDIAETTARIKDIAEDLPAIHALSGCDTVAATYGIGKPTAIKVAKRGKSLSLMGNVTAHLSDIASQATEFITACYGKHVEGSTTMTECRQKIWAYKTCRGRASAPKLRSLPPTSAAFLENVKRCHYQVCNWKSALLPDPPSMSPTEFGWETDIENKTLLARSLPDATALAPDYILKLIRCSCHSGVPCKAGNCSCLRNQLTCTVFCACEGSRLCCNPYTEHTDDGEDDLHMFDDADADFTLN